MEFKCSECPYTSNRKYCVKTHINKKNKCCESEIVPYILEVPIEIRCEHCEKKYTTQPSLKRHLKTCKVLKANHAAELAEKDRQIMLLEAKLEAERTKGPTTVINIQVNGYKNTDFSKLTDRHFSSALNRTLMSVPKMIEYTHFNEDIPENQNIYINNQKGKYAMVYDGKNWCIKDQEQTIDKLIDDQEYELEEWVNKVGDEHPKEMKKFQKYMSVKEKDGALDAMKEEVRMLLYNKRNMIKAVK